MIGEWSPWDYDNPGFVNALHEWAESHKRVQMLVYFQGFGDEQPVPDPALPAAAERHCAKQLDNRRYMRFAPHSNRARKGGKGGGRRAADGGAARGLSPDLSSRSRIERQPPLQCQLPDLVLAVGVAARPRRALEVVEVGERQLQAPGGHRRRA